MRSVLWLPEGGSADVVDAEAVAVVTACGACVGSGDVGAAPVAAAGAGADDCVSVAMPAARPTSNDASAIQRKARDLGRAIRVFSSSTSAARAKLPVGGNQRWLAGVAGALVD